MPKINLTPEDKAKLIEAINNDTEPSPDLLPMLFPGTVEKIGKFDVQALDRAKIPTLEYAGKRSKAAILAKPGLVSVRRHSRPCAVLARLRTMSGKI